jgi:hypothetical protein
MALALALSLLFKVACREMDGIDNRLIVTSDARLHSNLKDGTEIFF